MKMMVFNSHVSHYQRVCSCDFPIQPLHFSLGVTRGEGKGSSCARSVGTWRGWRRDAKLYSLHGCNGFSFSIMWKFYEIVYLLPWGYIYIYTHIPIGVCWWVETAASKHTHQVTPCHALPLEVSEISEDIPESSRSVWSRGSSAMKSSWALGVRWQTEALQSGNTLW